MVNTEGPLSQAAIGRALGLSPAAMTKLKKQGMPVDSVEAAQAWRVQRQNVAQRKPLPAGVGAGVSLAPSAPNEAVPTPAHLHAPGVSGAPSMSGVSGASALAPWPGAMGHEDDHPFADVPDETFESARIRRTIAEANLAELEESRIKGLHVEKAKVDAAFFEAARGLRDGMTNCSRRLAAEVATLGDPHACEAVISKELRHLLESFSQMLHQKISTPKTEEVGL
jgi:hypothetical protein